MSIPSLQALLTALETGACKFIKLLSDELKKHKESHNTRLISGEIPPCKWKQRSNAGGKWSKKWACITEEDSSKEKRNKKNTQYKSSETVESDRNKSWTGRILLSFKWLAQLSAWPYEQFLYVDITYDQLIVSLENFPHLKSSSIDYTSQNWYPNRTILDTHNKWLTTDQSSMAISKNEQESSVWVTILILYTNLTDLGVRLVHWVHYRLITM